MTEKQKSSSVLLLFYNIMKQHFLYIILALTISVGAWANGTEINGIYYILDQYSKKASVTYRGTSVSTANTYSGNIIIPASITYNSITYNVTSIGTYAFYECTGLTSVTIGSRVTSIGDEAFKGCTSLTSITIPNSVTHISSGAFKDCTGLTSVIIPNSVTSIGDYTFSGCSGLTNITIPNSVHSIGSHAFEYCNGLTSISIPSNVTTIGWSAFSNCTSLETAKIGNGCSEIPSYMFAGCTNLKEVIIGDENARDECGKIDMSAFPDKGDLNVYIFGKYVFDVKKAKNDNYSSILYGHHNPKFYVPFQSRTMLSMWKAYEGRIYDIQTKNYIGRPHMSVSQTQTTMTISISPIYDFLEYEYDGKPLEEADIFYNGLMEGTSITIIKYTGLRPDEVYFHTLRVKYLQDFYDDNGEEYAYPYLRDQFTTRSLYPNISAKTYPSSLHFTTSYRKEDAIITSTKFVVNNKVIPESESQDGKYDVYYTGLDPKQSIYAVYEITVSYGKNNESSYTYTEKLNTTTPDLTLTTLSPKVTNKGEAVVSAKTNLDEIETRAGFEWRKTDAPDVVESKRGEAIIYNGTMEGKIMNLDTSVYWKVRAYYKSNSGNMYYGDWIGIDPSDFSYFEPTVHTYSDVAINGISVTLTGMAIEGSDPILEQGFEYWNDTSASNSTRSAAESPQRVTATGQRMQVTLTDLTGERTYYFRSYVRTAKGTFYGEQQSFSSPSEETSDIQVSTMPRLNSEIFDVYDIRGMKVRSKTTSLQGLPKGLYLISGRKVYVK